MPIYEYECTVCAHRFETMQRISDPPLESCPECGEPVRKLISAPAFQFKGSGWYVTDYGGKGKDKGQEKKSSGSAGDSDGGSKSGGASESKPAKDSASTGSKPAKAAESS